jgi:hypothetical protein
MIENQDWNVGRVLSKLEALEIADNTIIVYFSDNGPNSWRWNDGMKGRKGSTDEGGIRSACFIRWPERLPAGHEVSEITGAIDLLPTLVALAGIERVGNKPLDGRDLTPLLMNQEIAWPERVLFSTWAGRISARSQRYRLDHQGNLYDMPSDPGQTRVINTEAADVAAQMQAAVRQWQADVYGEPGVQLGSNRSVDPRPIPLGFRQFPITMLPARDGVPQGEVKRSSTAPNCSYFVNWASLADRLVWSVDVETSGRYAVAIDYTCPLEDAGSLVELSVGSSTLSGRVVPGWDPPLYTNQDTLPRPPAESQMKEFRSLDLGEMELVAGAAALTLRALEIPGRSVMDVRRITLTLLD